MRPRWRRRVADHGVEHRRARLLRESQWTQVDRENVAEEIESLGREQFNKLESALRIVLMHMLKWDHQPTRRPRGWILSIKAHRIEIEDILSDNPGLRQRIAEAIARAYRRARIEAAKETGLEETAFPESCTYGFDEILSRDLAL